jgi:xanthine/CO dehydrogenase XdhC/CoxF family maturation factor
MLIGEDSLIILADEAAADRCVLRPLLAGAKPAYLALAANTVDGLSCLDQSLKDELEEKAVDKTLLRAGLDLGGRSDRERALEVVAELLAVTRGASCRPLQEIKGAGPPVAQTFADRPPSSLPPNLVIVGHSSITEELAWLATRLGWPVSVDSAGDLTDNYPVPEVRVITFDTDFSRLPVDAESSVVVASHHKGDHLAIERALSAGAGYVGLIASAHRSALVRGMLPRSLTAADADALSYLRTPAGLDLGATSPAEIALSVMSEVLAVRYGRVGQPRRVL